MALGHRFDSALRGARPLKAHLARALELETGKDEGQICGGTFWDLRKFYDSIKFSKLIPRLEDTGYPVHSAAIGLLAHRGPRLLSLWRVPLSLVERCGPLVTFPKKLHEFI